MAESEYNPLVGPNERRWRLSLAPVIRSSD